VSRLTQPHRRKYDELLTQLSVQLLLKPLLVVDLRSVFGVDGVNVCSSSLSRGSVAGIDLPEAGAADEYLAQRAAICFAF
jgi:hypothetical protein